MGDTLITTVEQDGVLHAVMCSPPGNNLDAALTAILSQVVAEFDRGPAKVLLLSSGLAGHFAGGDLVGSGLGVDWISDQLDSLREPLARLSGCHKPSIAVVEGHAVGLGFELALACTWRFCAPAAKLGFPAAPAGSLPGAGGTHRLPQLVGPSRALDLMLTGREVRGEEALRLGLADRVFYRDCVAESLAEAQLVATASGPAVKLLMGCVEAALDLPPEMAISVERAALVSLLDDR